MIYAKLRVCASCEWVFKSDLKSYECPKCGFASYGARYVYGKAAYRIAKTQEKWMDKKMFAYETELLREIRDSKCSGICKESLLISVPWREE